MKDHTILVVVCINNEELFEQCERQIRNLLFPGLCRTNFSDTRCEKYGECI